MSPYSSSLIQTLWSSDTARRAVAELMGRFHLSKGKTWQGIFVPPQHKKQDKVIDSVQYRQKMFYSPQKKPAETLLKLATWMFHPKPRPLHFLALGCEKLKRNSHLVRFCYSIGKCSLLQAWHHHMLGITSRSVCLVACPDKKMLRYQ